MDGITRLYVANGRRDVARNLLRLNMDNLEMNATDRALILEAVYENPNRDVYFRAITVEMDQENGARSVADIAEALTIDILREQVKTEMPSTHYASQNWADALRVLKSKLHKIASDEGVSISRGASPVNMCNAIRQRRDEVNAAELRRIESKNEAASKFADRDSRAAERKDFTAWAKLVRDNLTHEDADYSLAVAMRNAYLTAEKFTNEILPKHIDKLTSDPFYTLSWSGSFVEATAENVLAKWAIERFEKGVSAQTMQTEATDMMFRSDRASSRSTSVMANLTDDALRVAWINMAKRLSGRSYG